MSLETRSGILILVAMLLYALLEEGARRWRR